MTYCFGLAISTTPAGVEVARDLAPKDNFFELFFFSLSIPNKLTKSGEKQSFGVGLFWPLPLVLTDIVPVPPPNLKHVAELLFPASRVAQRWLQSPTISKRKLLETSTDCVAAPKEGFKAEI